MAKRSATIIELKGAARLRKTLKEAGSDLNDLKTANRNAADTVVSAAKPATPYKDGYLQASVRATATKREGRIRAGNNRTSKTGVPYANPIHWGWPSRKIKANPWLLQAARKTEPQWLIAYKAALAAAVKKVTGI